jgi:hypothetical protein
MATVAGFANAATTSDRESCEMPSSAMKITVRHVTVDQLVEEIGKFKFAGYGNCKVQFAVTGTEILSVTAEKDLGGSRPTAKAAPAKAAK